MKTYLVVLMLTYVTAVDESHIQRQLYCRDVFMICIKTDILLPEREKKTTKKCFILADIKYFKNEFYQDDTMQQLTKSG